MTKEWQEATNEYLKVSLANTVAENTTLTVPRKNVSILSTVSAAKVIKARVTCRASRQRLRVSLLSPRNSCTVYGSFPWCPLQNFVGGTHGWFDAYSTYISTVASKAYVQKLNLIDCAILLVIVAEDESFRL